MLQKSFIILWLLFQLLFKINCQMTPFNPQQRIWHTATYIDNKLYILGGYSTVVVGSLSEFFYLDVSGPLNTTNKDLPWQDSSTNTIPSHYGAASVKGGADNNTLFLYGGFTRNTT